MAPGLSLYLDLVRFLAAFSVFGFHLGYGKLVGEPFGVFRDLGTNGVMIFFVLSGFVIGHVAHTREITARRYAIARLGRLYSVAIPALLLTIPLDFLGSRAAPDLYPILPNVNAFFAYLFFMHMAWDRGAVFGTLAAYWSLGYEVWYYIVFGLYRFVPGPGRFVWAIAACAFAGPGITLLLPLWLLGYGIHGLCRAWRPPPAMGVALFAGTIIVFGLCLRTDLFEPIAVGIGQTPRSLALEYLTGVLFAANVLGAHAISGPLARLLGYAARPIRWLAGATFTLYLMHLPLAFFIRSHISWPVEAWQSKLLVFGGTMAAVLVLAAFTERRKQAWQRLFAFLIPERPALPDTFRPSSAMDHPRQAGARAGD